MGATKWLLALAGVALGCATLADTGGGDVALPNAGIGPFREITSEELGDQRPAPYALRDDEEFLRDATVVDLDGEPGTFEVWAYVARTTFPEGADPDPTAPPNEIVRFGAIDARTFARRFETVLVPELAWEDGWLGQPSALRVAGQTWLYYAAAGGIGLARSDDGLAFDRLDAPVLAADAVGWEQGAVPASPAVLRLPDGRFRMFYEVPLSGGGSAIAEAESSDGQSWQRLHDAAVLAPRDGAEQATTYDATSVGAPQAVLGASAQGRTLLWLYYGAVDGAGKGTVAVAARDGIDGGFARATAPVFGAGGALGPTEPWVLRYGAFSLLFATQRAGSGDDQDYPAVAVGVAPANERLPPPVWE